MHQIIHHQYLNGSISNICIYCIYVQNEGIPAYIIHNIKAIKECGYDTIIVSHSALQKNDVDTLKPYCVAVVEKENIGYDFFAWKFGMDLSQDIPGLENLLLINDSIIGPFFSLKGVFEKMNNSFDFWGLTENEEHKYHLQSYFLHANRKTRETIAWKSFWSDMQLYEDKLDIVKNYEVELTQVLLTEPDIKVGAWVSSSSLETYKQDRKYIDFPKAEFWTGISNPTIRFWKELIANHQYPYIKKNLFFDKEHYHVVTNGIVHVYNVFPTTWKNVLKKAFGTAAVDLIENFLDSYYENKYSQAKVVKDRYKYLLVCKHIQSSEQADYLIRLLRFFIDINVSVELVVQESLPDLPVYYMNVLHDLGKITILDQMSRNEVERHRCTVSQEKIALLFIVEEYSADLAASYLYTGSRPVLLATQSIQHQYLRRLETLANRFCCPIISPLVTLKEGLPGAEVYIFDPLNTSSSLVGNKFNYPGNNNLTKKSDSFIIGIHGVENLMAHEKNIARVVGGILSKDQSSRFYLFLNATEERYCKQLLSNKQSEYRKAIDAGRLQFIFDKETELSMAKNREISLSVVYESGQAITQLVCEQARQCVPVLYMQEGKLLEELFGESINEIAFDYFELSRLIDEILVLQSSEKQYTQKGLLLKRSVENYAQKIDNRSEIEHLITNELVDFSELRALIPKITVIFHFHFYSFDKAAFQYYKRRLREFSSHNIDYLFSITSDSYNINEYTSELRLLFKNSEIKIVPNKGRDIGAKFLLFDYYLKQGANSEYLVVLHDKKSLHLPFWEARAWIESLLKIIDPIYTRQIITRFETNSNIGIIGSGERIMDCILRWEQKGAVPKPVFEWNNDILHELINHLGLDITDYRFVGGTMFWIKNTVLKKIDQRYNFIEKFEELEEGNVMDNNGSTITHSWERLLCWSSTDLGYNVTGI